MTDLDLAIHDAVIAGEWALIVMLLCLGVPAVFGLFGMVRRGMFLLAERWSRRGVSG